MLEFPTRSQYLTLTAALAFLPFLTSRISLCLAFLLLGLSRRVALWSPMSRLVALLSPNLAFLRWRVELAPACRLARPQTTTLPFATTTQSSVQLTATAIGSPAFGFLSRESFTCRGCVSAVKLVSTLVETGGAGVDLGLGRGGVDV